MHHPNHSILYQPIKYAHIPFLESISSQLIEDGFKQRKEEALPRPLSNSNSVLLLHSFANPGSLGILPPLLWKGFSISLLRCTGLLKAQLWSRKGENIP